jgi:hypothetical protein
MEGRPLKLTPDTFIVGFDPEFELAMEFVNTDKSREILQSKLREFTRKAMKIKIVSANDPSIPEGDEPMIEPSSVRGTPLDSDTTFENDPLIKTALEIFKGQIVEIRR